MAATSHIVIAGYMVITGAIAGVQHPETFPQHSCVHCEIFSKEIFHSAPEEPIFPHFAFVLHYGLFFMSGHYTDIITYKEGLHFFLNVCKV